MAGVSGELDPPTFQMVDNSLYLMSHSHYQSLTCLPNPSKSIHTPNLNKLIRELEHAINLCLRISSFISQTNVLNMIQKHMFLLWLHGRLVDLFSFYNMFWSESQESYFQTLRELVNYSFGGSDSREHVHVSLQS